ncbi:hypothetical protein D3C76_681330 [compost metagenome]
MNSPSTQTGMALLVSLVLLLLLTIIAITAASQSTLQERMAANSQQQNIAFQAAESGVRAWLDEYEKNPRITAISTGTVNLAPNVPYSASAAVPSNCSDIMPAYSLNGGDGSASFQYACFNIESVGKACSDSTCADADNPARARHLQGQLVRY